MRRVILSRGNSIGVRLFIAVFVIIGVLLLVFFAAIALAVAVILIPIGIILFIARKLLFSGINPEKEPGAETANQAEINDIIDITDYEETKDVKVLYAGKKDGE